MVPIGVLIPFLPPHLRGFEQDATRAITASRKNIFPIDFIKFLF